MICHAGQRHTHRTLRGVETLHAPLAVGERTVALGKTLHGQHDLCPLRQFVREQAEDDQRIHFVEPRCCIRIIRQNVRLRHNQHARRRLRNIFRCFWSEAEILLPHRVCAGECRQQTVIRLADVLTFDQEVRRRLHQRAAAVERQALAACDDDQVARARQLIGDLRVVYAAR